MRHALLFAAAASLLFAAPALAKHPKKKRPDVAAQKEPPAAPTPPAGDAKTAPAGEVKTAAPAPAVGEVISRIQKFYEATTDLHARFEQELVASIGGKKKASGEVWLKKPGRMRWEYGKPEKKLMVADGSALWVYEPDDEQAFKQNLKTSSLPSSVTFLFGTGKLTDEFTVTVEKPEGVGGAEDVVLKLVPIKPTAQYRYLYFVVDAKAYLVKETLVYDQQGGVNHMKFRDVETNKGVANGKFEFSPPTGTKIIRP